MSVDQPGDLINTKSKLIYNIPKVATYDSVLSNVHKFVQQLNISTNKIQSIKVRQEADSRIPMMMASYPFNAD